MRKLIIFSLLLCLHFQCQSQKRNVRSGIKGQLTWKAGNQMPSPDRPASSGKGVKREVWIYEATNQSQTQQQDGFYTKIRTKLVKKVVTDAHGAFTVSLSPGTYSVFTKETKGLWANITDGANVIFPVKVEKGRYTPVAFEINYAATF